MHLIQILLPLTDNSRRPWERRRYSDIKRELTQKFGGITAHSRAPAEGRWRNDGQQIRDDIIIYEVMVDAIEAAWWQDYRQKLETRFKQEEIVIRALPVQQL